MLHILQPHSDLSDPVWSVIILLVCGLCFTLYCVAYILIMAYEEMREDGQTQEQEREVRQCEAESGQRNSEES